MVSGMGSSKKIIDYAGNVRVVTLASSPKCSILPPAEPTRVVKILPGTLGLEFNEANNDVIKVSPGTGKDAGVEVGWLLLLVGKKKVAGSVKEVFNGTNNKSTTCVFKVPASPPSAPQETWEEVIEEPTTGTVVLNYNLYSGSFTITGGRLSPATVDEEYCLSDVMPGCVVKLSNVKTDTKGTTLAHPELLFADRSQIGNPYVSQDSKSGEFVGLADGKEYWVYVVEDPVQEEEDCRNMGFVVLRMKEDAGMVGDNDEGGSKEYNELCREAGISESCSCVEGNPCVSEYACRDWYRRFQVAGENGWKGSG